MAQEVDQQGRSSGGYSWSMPGGGTTSVAFGADQYVEALASDDSRTYGADKNSMRTYGVDPTGLGHHSITGYDFNGIGHNSITGYNSNGIGHNSMTDYDSNGIGHNSMTGYDSNGIGHNSMTDYDSYGLGHNSMKSYGSNRYASSDYMMSYRPSSTESYEAEDTWSESDWSPSTTSTKMDSSYVMKILGPDSQWIESSSPSGERSGYYSYLTGEGETVLIRYTAGREGFRVLDSQGVPGLALNPRY